MKVFVINLKMDHDRWASVEAQLQRAGLDYERMPAILGRSLGPQELAVHYSPLKSSWRQARELTPAEIGCALSHLRTYREIVKRGLSHALILEDDVVLEDGIAELLDDLASHMPAEVPIACLLSPAETAPSGQTVTLAGGYTLQPFEAGYFTSSYFLTRAAAAYLLADLHPVGDVADCWKRLKQTGKLTLFALTPAPVIQNQLEFGSSTTEDIHSALGGSFVSKMIYRLRRVRNILLAGLLERRWMVTAQPADPQAPHPIDGLRES